MKLNSLTLSWSVSRGRDTYGYNICRLDDRNNGKRYRCNGGGYDMVGTVFGEWLQDVYQDRLLNLMLKAHSTWSKSEGKTYHNDKGFYGMSYYIDENRIVLDGACGLDCMIRIAEAIGLEVQRNHDKKGNTTGWLIVEPPEEVTS